MLTTATVSIGIFFAWGRSIKFRGKEEVKKLRRELREKAEALVICASIQA
jgi:hypothetical protein